MKLIENPTKDTWEELSKRPTPDYAALENDVKAIFQRHQNSWR